MEVYYWLTPPKNTRVKFAKFGKLAGGLLEYVMIKSASGKLVYSLMTDTEGEDDNVLWLDGFNGYW